MNYNFDDLARSLASGISRRQALKRMGAGLAGLMLSSIGIKKAFATVAVTCGSCQACDLDTSTCGLPCSPASSGQTLCNAASQDGTYQRLLQYLTSNGFESPGASETVVLYKGGSLYQSALGTILQSSTNPNQVARVAYLVSPAGDITSAAVVVDNLIPVYGLNVNPNGRVIQTIATQTLTTPPKALKGAVAGPASSKTSAPTHKGLQVDAAKALVSQATCNRLVDIVCGVVGSGFICWLVGEAACAAGAIVTLGAIEIPCALAVGVLCGAGGYVACELEKDAICECEFNEQSCNGVCCDQCQDCLNGACVPGSNISSCPSGVCCDGICCPNNYTCQDGVCTSPDPACNGAVCGSFTSGCLYDNDECFCGAVVEGGGECWCNAYCDAIPTCSSSADCGSGAVCAIDTCCEIPVCLAICTPGCTLGYDVRRESLSVNRPTAGHH